MTTERTGTGKLYRRLLMAWLGLLLGLGATTAQAGWLPGGIVESTITNCPSIIFATPQKPPYTEAGAAAFVSYWSDAGTRANNTYYVSIFVSGQGNACSGQRFYPEIQLPPNTTLDISATNPVVCFADGVRTGTNECQQVLPASLYNAGAFAIWSTDTVHANLWPLPQGHNWQFNIPVRSSTALTGVNLRANIHVLDGETSPWLYPTVSMIVGAATGGTTLTPQTITFGPNPGPRTFTPGGTFAVTATASSGLPVTFTSHTPAICTNSGSTVAMVSAGTCTIVADQAGNTSYGSAQATQSIIIQAAAPVTQNITFGTNPGPVNFTAGGTFLVSATASSNLPVVFSGTTPTICTVSGNTVTMLAMGTCTVAADQAGDTTYAAAPQVTQSIVIRAYLGAIAWTPGHIMATTRANHTATLLPNGKVLVAGGFGGASPTYLNTAELYDPVSDSWTTPTGIMTMPRAYHTATVVGPVGEVLLAGGHIIGGITATAEMYYPASNTSWFAVASMSVPRESHTATRLNDGRVLVVGGYYEAGTPPATTPTWLASAEIYNRTTNTWTSVAPMATARAAHTATLLASGKVLVVGGNNNTSGVLATAELYDPVTNVWTAAGSPGERESHTATLLPDGRVMVTGGSVPTSVSPTHVTGSTVLYDPGTNGWVGAASMPSGRFAHSASLMPNGQVLVTAGLGATAALSDTVLYDPATNTWTTVNPLVYGRSYHTATLLANGKVAVMGGSGSTGATNTVELIENSNLRWGSGGAMAQARGNFTTTLLPDGKVIAVGGHTGASQATSATSVETYDPSGNFWMTGTALGTQRGAHTATLMATGKLLVTGGVSGTSYLSGTELYDTTAKTWSAGPPLATARAFHTANMLASGDVVVVGGEVGGGTPIASAERLNTQTNTWVSAGNLVQGRAEHTATMLGNGKIVVAGGRGIFGASLNSVEMFNPATSLTTWANIGSLGTPRYGHTATQIQRYWVSGDIDMVLFAGGYDSTTGSYLSDTRLYNPAGVTPLTTWLVLPALNQPRAFHQAILLPNGTVLVVGGRTTGGVPVKSAELFDPKSLTWSLLGDISLARDRGAIALLANSNVLVSGGFSGSTPTPSGLADVLDIGVVASRQSVVSSARASAATGKVSLTGSGLTGDSEASGGNSQSSASNVPVVQLRREDNGWIQWLGTNGFSASSYLSDTPSSFPYGVYRATPIINGVPGVAKLFTFPSPPIAPNPPDIASVQAGPGAITVNFNAPYDNGGAAIDWYTVSCTPTAGGTAITAQGTGTSVRVSGLAKGVAYSCSVTAHNSAGTSTASLALTTTTRKSADITPFLMLLLD